MNRKKVALITGGYSAEAEISYWSAENVFNNLDTNLYDTYKIEIAESGWYFTDSSGVKQSVNKNDFSIHVNGERMHFDIAFMCLHGTPGEDGKILGYFDMLGIRYTSSSAMASAVTMNKRYTVAIAATAGVCVSNSVLVTKKYPIPFDKIEALKFPVFIKPNTGGSSVNLSKITNFDSDKIKAAIDRALEEKETEEVLVEEFVEGREFTIGVFRDENREIITLPMTEIILKKGREVFDFDAKYNGETTETTPAETSQEIADKIAAAAKKAYAAVGCSGVVRIDFIYNETLNEPFMLEINSVPGQTKESIIPKQVKAIGWDLKEFYSRLIEAGLRK